MNDEQLLRYSRHLLLPQVDIAGQETLLASSALVVGLGGLGSPVALYLAASGVGRLLLVDDDQVELSNLQRQIAHATGDLNQPKVASAKASAQALNPDVQIDAFAQNADQSLLEQLIPQCQVVVDCTDNLGIRQLINRLSYQAQTPLVSASAIGLEGQLMVVDASQHSPCYQCLYSDVNDSHLTCADSGVLAPLVGVMGSMQALEVLKVLLGQAQPGCLHLYDAWAGHFRKMTLPKDPNCPVCSGH